MSDTFQSFWHGELSPYERLCLSSFVGNGHSVDLYSYRNMRVPNGVRLRNAANIIEWRDLRSSDGEVPASFSNQFRYLLLRDRGGWWVDLDVVCLTYNPPTDDLFFARQDDDWINNAVMRFPAGHVVMQQCADQQKIIGQDDECGVKGGPFLFTQALRECNCDCLAADRMTCYPIAYAEAASVTDPEQGDRLAGQVCKSQFLHLWNQVLAREGVDKTVEPRPGSLMHKLVRRYGWEE